MTFPGLEKKNGIPSLFQVFQDWIHPVLYIYKMGIHWYFWVAVKKRAIIEINY